MLSDKDKRRVYDAYGEEGLKSGGAQGSLHARQCQQHSTTAALLQSQMHKRMQVRIEQSLVHGEASIGTICAVHGFTALHCASCQPAMQCVRGCLSGRECTSKAALLSEAALQHISAFLQVCHHLLKQKEPGPQVGTTFIPPHAKL